MRKQNLSIRMPDDRQFFIKVKLSRAPARAKQNASPPLLQSGRLSACRPNA
jgi:hypothetical protein